MSKKITEKNDSENKLVEEEESDEEIVSPGENPTSNENKVTDDQTNSKRFPKKGEQIQIKNGEDWENVTVTGRGGKVGGKYENWFNIQKRSGENECADLDGDREWRFSEDVIEEVNVVGVPKEEHLREVYFHCQKLRQL